jgi:hypothetical protein
MIATGTTIIDRLNNQEPHSLLELAEAIEAGFGARYDDTGNYGEIVVYKAENKLGVYYFVWWGDDPEDMRWYSRLDHHFDRLRDRVEECGWQLMQPAEVEQWKARA